MIAYEVIYETETIKKGKMEFLHDDPNYVYSFIRYLLNNYHEVDISVTHVDQPPRSYPVGHA